MVERRSSYVPIPLLIFENYNSFPALFHPPLLHLCWQLPASLCCILTLLDTPTLHWPCFEDGTPHKH